MLCRSNGIPILNQANANNNNNNNYMLLNNKSDNQMNLNPIDNNQLNDTTFTTSYATFNHQNGNDLCDLDAKTTYLVNKSGEHQIMNSDVSNLTNINCSDNCMSSVLIYNENTPFQTNNDDQQQQQEQQQQATPASTTTTNFNQSNKGITPKKAKKRANNATESNEFTNTRNQKMSKLDMNSKEAKTLKEEPISPKNAPLKQQDRTQHLNENQMNSAELFEQTENTITKYSKHQTNNTRFVIATKLATNRVHQPDSKTTIFDSDPKDSIESTLTSNKDPTLASSSISSPSSPSSSSSSHSSSSNSSSLCHS